MRAGGLCVTGSLACVCPRPRGWNQHRWPNAAQATAPGHTRHSKQNREPTSHLPLASARYDVNWTDKKRERERARESRPVDHKNSSTLIVPYLPSESQNDGRADGWARRPSEFTPSLEEAGTCRVHSEREREYSMLSCALCLLACLLACIQPRLPENVREQARKSREATALYYSTPPRTVDRPLRSR